MVFDPRCVLLPGESMRFYANAACTELVAAATQDDRRKGFLPLTLPSPVWMAVHSAAAQGGSDDGESAWGYRLLAAALGEPHLALALWLAELFSAPRAGVGGTGALLLPRRRVQEVLEAALDLLAHGPSLAAPHCAQLHAWTCRLVCRGCRAAGLHDAAGDPPSVRSARGGGGAAARRGEAPGGGGARRGGLGALPALDAPLLAR